MELYLPPIKALVKTDSKGRFVKGTVSWNKGKKGLNIGGKQSQFKPGHEPHNAKYNGAVSIRKDSKTDKQYKYIRLAKAKWELLHRYVWKKHNGNIPSNMIVVFKDGNSLNCNINNLEIITKKENMQRNRNTKKAAKSLANTWRIDKLRLKYGLQPKTKWLQK